MAAALVTSAGTHFPSGGTPLTQDITVSGTNPVLIVHVPAQSQFNDQQFPLTVTWSLGGVQSLTRKATKRCSLDGQAAYASTWVREAPAAGAGTVTVTFDIGIGARACHIIAEVWSGADQTNPCPVGDVVQKDTAESPTTATPSNLATGDATSGVVASTPVGASSITPNTAYVDGVASTGVQAAEGWATDTAGIGTSGGATWQINHAITAVRIVAATGSGLTPSVVAAVLTGATGSRVAGTRVTVPTP